MHTERRPGAQVVPPNNGSVYSPRTHHTHTHTQNLSHTRTHVHTRNELVLTERKHRLGRRERLLSREVASMIEKEKKKTRKKIQAER